MKINFGLGPNNRQVGSGEILKFRPVKTSAVGILWVVTLLGVEVKNEIILAEIYITNKTCNNYAEN
jgi:hypothetical protein